MKNANVEAVLWGSWIGAGLSALITLFIMFKSDLMKEIWDCNTTATFQSIQLIRSDFLLRFQLKCEIPTM